MFGHAKIFTSVIERAQAIVDSLTRRFGVSALSIKYDSSLKSKRGAAYEQDTSTIFLADEFILDSLGTYCLLHEFAHHLDKRDTFDDHDKIFCSLLCNVLQSWEQDLEGYDYRYVMNTVKSMYKHCGQKCNIHYQKHLFY